MDKPKSTFENITKGMILKYLKDGRIAIIFDPNKDFGKSKRGNSLVIASSGGFKMIPYLDKSNEEQSIFINLFIGKN